MAMPETASCEHTATPFPANGATDGPRAPRIEEWVEIPDYPGYLARVWVNYPERLYREMQSGEQAATAAAARQIVLEHNGWCDANGEPLPSAQDEAFWDAMSLHLSVRVLGTVRAKALELPNFLGATRRR